MARSGRRFGTLADESFEPSVVCCRFCRPLGAHPGALPATASTLHSMVGESAVAGETPDSFEALVAFASETASGRSALPALESMPLPRDLAQSTMRRKVFGLAPHGPRTRLVFLGLSTMNSRRFLRRSSEGNGRKSARVLGSLPSPSRGWRLVLCSAVCSEPLRGVMLVGGTFGFFGATWLCALC